ncbi:SAF domain-containing protein [Streptantibioticus ferralitis]|uniref:SAF domain-containing protein n=1 Tax=Streptantibioticus ferralitis TaxID=236510 RepID=UPI0023DAFCD5|nr:SAF domain-containing protein [Streptantibioticus ferralitis]
MGVLLVLGCATGGVVAGTQLGQREAVLALARPVTVGQVLTAQDVREVSMSAHSGLEVIPARSLSSVEGRPLAYSLPAGALLTRDVLGAAQVPPAGQAVAAVGLKAGQFPPGLQPGNRVTVVMSSNGNAATGASSSSTSSTSSWSATVTAVQTDTTAQTTVVALQMASSDARQLAAAPTGQISVVEVNGSGQ